MRTSPLTYLVSAWVVLACLLSVSCSLNSASLRTQSTGKPEIAGTCTLILYGAHFYNNITTVALIIPEGGRYVFDIYSPEYNYRTLKGVKSAEAIETAERFVRWHPESMRSQTSKIFDNEGRVIAYEVRPLYNPVTFGVQDVMNVDYFLEGGNKVVVHISLVDRAEKVFMGDDQGKVH